MPSPPNSSPAEPLNVADAPGVAPDPTPPPIPEHQLIRLVGSGGSGQVWLARNTLGTYRAVKVVYKRLFRPNQAFDREFNGLVKFEPVSRLHDGLVDVLQVGGGDDAGYFYCVMELADDIATGQIILPEQYTPRTLAFDLAQRRRLPIDECVRLGAAIASAVSFLHRHGLIHRDIKPSNIIFVNGFPKLADVGLVTATSEPRSYVGTEGFIPPEGAGTPRADIYSLGKVLYQISTGKDRNDYPELPSDLSESAEDQDLVRFIKIVLKACRTAPVRRFRSAYELMTALLAFGHRSYDRRRKRTHRLWYNLIGYLGLLLALAILSILVWRLVWLLTHSQ